MTLALIMSYLEEEQRLRSCYLNELKRAFHHVHSLSNNNYNIIQYRTIQKFVTLIMSVGWQNRMCEKFLMADHRIKMQPKNNMFKITFEGTD